MLTVLALVVYVLVVARLTRLVTTDKITEPLRAKVIERIGARSQLSYLVHCQACSSIWVAGVLALPAAWVAGLPWWWAPALALGASQATIVLSRGDLN